MRCSSCEIEVPEGAKFCPECGTRQAAELLSEGENRQLTVMFVDLVGSTALSEQLDPEQLRDVVAVYQEHVGRVIQARGGTIAQYLGDGVLVYFGYPSAHEDDPDRSVLAGLEVLGGRDEMNDALEREFGVRLQLRIGVHTGDVVVAPLGDSRERLAVGMTVNVAARLSDATGSDTLAISEFTRKLLGRSVELEPMGGLTLKGVSQPVEAYRVIRERADEVPAVALEQRAFFGREHELSTMTEAFEALGQGGARTIVIEGEAGIGKSRLLSAFRQRIADEPHRWLEARCSHFHQATALRPIAQVAAQAVELTGLQDAAAQLAQLEKALAGRRDPADRAVGLLLQMFGLEVPRAFALPEFSPDRIRADTMRAAIDAIAAAASLDPLVLVIEDLHWIDPSSLEVLDALARGSEAPLLLVVARRPDAPTPWPPPQDFAHIKLERLGEQALDDLISFHAGGIELAGDIRATIQEKADGVPLFAEELTKMVVESESTGGSFGVPATLQDSLMARLDRLPRGKPVAQIAAAIGRSFDAELVAQVAELSPDVADQGFQQLVGADLVEWVGGAESNRYVFRHALIQDAAYRSLLRRDRVRVHARIAGALVDAGAANAEPARVAHHYAESKQPKPAIELWMRAGQTALDASAAKEAILHYQSALPLIERLPDEERDALELGLHIGLAYANVATTGYGAAAVQEHFTRATEICDRSPGGQTLFSVASGLWGFQLVHGEPAGAEAAVARVMEMAEASQKPRHLFHAHYADGAQAFYTGQFERALRSLNAANEMIAQGRSIRGYGTSDSAANCPMYLGWAEHFLGFCDRGFERQMAGMANAEKSGQIFPTIETLVHVVNLRHDRLEAEGTVALCDRALDMALEYGFNFWLGICYSVRGWAKARCGEIEEGISEATQGLEIFRATGAYVPYVYRASYLVETLMCAGRYREALAEIDRALEKAEGRYDRFWDAEIHRLRAVALLHTAAPQEAVEQQLHRAMALAEAQRARILSLRATTTWAQWLQGEGRGAEARETLLERTECIEASADLEDVRAAREVLTAL